MKIKEKVLKESFKNILNFAKTYVNTIDEETGKPYLNRTEDEVLGISLGELKRAIDLTLAEVGKVIDDVHLDIHKSLSEDCPTKRCGYKEIKQKLGIR